MASLWDIFKRSVHVDYHTFDNNRVNRMLGTHLPQYTLPHIQWQNHVNNANHITNMQNPPLGNLVQIGRYKKLRIK